VILPGLASPEERAGLLVYLRRLLSLDLRAAVRLQASSRVLGVWGSPPLDVLTLRPVALAEPLTRPLDVTLSATRLAERLEAAPEAGDAPTELPPNVPGPAWAGLLPPRGGWVAGAVVPAATVHDAVRVAVEGFARRRARLTEPDRSQAALQAIADELWAAPVVGAVPLRAAQAADLTGLLGQDGEVTAYATPGWLRLGCAGGSVAVRTEGRPGRALDLGVWSLVSPADT
jgi:hypothetical protein